MLPGGYAVAGEVALTVRTAFGQIAERDGDRLLAPVGDDGLAGGEVGDERAQRDDGN